MALRIRLPEADSKPPRAAVVKSHGSERRGKSRDGTRQVRDRKTNESEPSMTRRKTKSASKLGALVSPRTSPPEIWLLGGRCSAFSWRDSVSGFCGELREPVVLMTREKSKWRKPWRMRVPMQSTGADQPVRALKAGNSAGAKGLGQMAKFSVQLLSSRRRP